MHTRLADFEPVYADRMKHVMAEDQPTFAGGFHQKFADNLAYDKQWAVNSRRTTDKGPRTNDKLERSNQH